MEATAGPQTIFAWINYSWPWINLGIRAADPPQSNNLEFNFTLSPLHPQVQLTSDGVCLYYVLKKKNPHINGPNQFQLVLRVNCTSLGIKK